MAQRSIGQERFGCGSQSRSASSLDRLIRDARPDRDCGPAQWHPHQCEGRGSLAAAPMFKALLLAVWYDLSDVKAGRSAR